MSLRRSPRLRAQRRTGAPQTTARSPNQSRTHNKEEPHVASTEAAGQEEQRLCYPAGPTSLKRGVRAVKLLPTVSPFRARLLIAVLALPLVQPMAARAQNPVFSGPPFLGIPLVDMKLSVTNTANGLQLQWINANPQLTASYEVYRNTGSGFVLLTPAHVGATSFSDRPSPVLPRMAVTYEVEAFWSNGTKGVSGPVSMTMASAPMDLHPGPQPLPDRRCFGRADLSAVNIYTVPPDYLGTVSLQFAFPSATQFPGGANVIVKDSRNQAVTTYHMAYVQ